MKVSFANAAAAYANRIAQARTPGLEPRGAAPAPDFANLVKDAAAATVNSLKESEAASLKATVGKADLGQVVTAVANAEVALQTAMAVRDRVIQAYLDIIKMPI